MKTKYRTYDTVLDENSVIDHCSEQVGRMCDILLNLRIGATKHKYRRYHHSLRQLITIICLTIICYTTNDEIVFCILLAYITYCYSNQLSKVLSSNKKGNRKQ